MDKLKKWANSISAYRLIQRKLEQTDDYKHLLRQKLVYEQRFKKFKSSNGWYDTAKMPPSLRYSFYNQYIPLKHGLQLNGKISYPNDNIAWEK